MEFLYEFLGTDKSIIIFDIDFSFKIQQKINFYVISNK